MMSNCPECGEMQTPFDYCACERKRNEERRDITRGIVGLPLTDEDCNIAEEVAAKILVEHFTTPVGKEIVPCDDCGEPSETKWKDGTPLCYGCAYGRAGWE
jgi:formylmethanofuran dehydrogenase subunit E